MDDGVLFIIQNLMYSLFWRSVVFDVAYTLASILERFFGSFRSCLQVQQIVCSCEFCLRKFCL